jgi:hypothetical protein
MNSISPGGRTTDHDDQTPAMASGLTDPIWSVRELLFYKVAPAPAPPAKRTCARPSIHPKPDPTLPKRPRGRSRLLVNDHFISRTLYKKTILININHLLLFTTTFLLCLNQCVIPCSYTELVEQFSDQLPGMENTCIAAWELHPLATATTIAEKVEGPHDATAGIHAFCHLFFLIVVVVSKK